MSGKPSRMKRADAIAEKYHVVCPYVSCGYNHILFTAVKDTVLRCENCRKEFKIRKVIAK